MRLARKLLKYFTVPNYKLTYCLVQAMTQSKLLLKVCLLKISQPQLALLTLLQTIIAKRVQKKGVKLHAKKLCSVPLGSPPMTYVLFAIEKTHPLHFLMYFFFFFSLVQWFLHWQGGQFCTLWYIRQSPEMSVLA